MSVERAPIAVVDYGIGNLGSAQKVLSHLGAEATLATCPAAVSGAAGVILSGVGAFGPSMCALRDRGLDAAVVDAVERGAPFLGICVGMQMLFERSEEDPGVPGLGLLAGTVRSLPPGEKHPQMQWNQLQATRPSRLLAGLSTGVWVYFMHSYAPEPSEHTVATCDYGGPIVAAVERGRLWATQFHPEKSGSAGLALMANFVAAAERR